MKIYQITDLFMKILTEKRTKHHNSAANIKGQTVFAHQNFPGKLNPL